MKTFTIDEQLRSDLLWLFDRVQDSVRKDCKGHIIDDFDRIWDEIVELKAN